MDTCLKKFYRKENMFCAYVSVVYLTLGFGLCMVWRRTMYEWEWTSQNKNL